jgi:Tat protein secretion system quality control protein TatD with DNase activity
MSVNLFCEKRVYDVQYEIVYWQPGYPFIPQNPFWAGINPDFWLGDKDFHLRQLNFMLDKNRCVGIGIIPDFLEEVRYIADFEELISLNAELLNKHKKYLYIHYSDVFLPEIKNIVEKFKREIFVGGFNGDMELFEKWKKRNNVLFSFGQELMGANDKAQFALRHCYSSNLFLQTGFSDVSIKYLIKKAGQILNIDEELLKSKILNNFKKYFNH